MTDIVRDPYGNPLNRDNLITALRAENEKLRAALRPFAALVTVDGESADEWQTKFPRFHKIVSDARAALGEKQ